MKKPTTIQEEMQRRADEFFKGLDRETKDIGVGVITNQSGPTSDTDTSWIYERAIDLAKRKAETHEAAVQRYLDSIPENETPEQRMQRINRFRCGY